MTRKRYNEDIKKQLVMLSDWKIHIYNNFLKIIQF